MILIKDVTIVTQNSQRQIIKNGAILDLATISGARALKIDDQVGSIDTGKDGDIVMINFDQPHLKPCFDAVSHLVYSVRGADVTRVIVAGKVLL